MIWRSLVTLVALFAFFSASCFGHLALAATKHPNYTKNPVLYVSGTIDSSMEASVLVGLEKALTDHEKQVIVLIDSGGGDVDVGLDMGKTFEAFESKGLAIQCVVDGMGASMAYYLLQYCTTRAITDRSELMAHEPSIQPTGGTRFDLRRGAERLDSLTMRLARDGSRRLKISYVEFLKRIADHNYWMTPDEALAVGAVDFVVKPVDLPHASSVTSPESWLDKLVLPDLSHLLEPAAPQQEKSDP